MIGELILAGLADAYGSGNKSLILSQDMRGYEQGTSPEPWVPSVRKDRDVRRKRQVSPLPRAVDRGTTRTRR